MAMGSEFFASPDLSLKDLGRNATIEGIKTGQELAENQMDLEAKGMENQIRQHTLNELNDPLTQETKRIENLFQNEMTKNKYANISEAKKTQMLQAKVAAAQAATQLSEEEKNFTYTNFGGVLDAPDFQSAQRFYTRAYNNAVSQGLIDPNSEDGILDPEDFDEDDFEIMKVELGAIVRDKKMRAEAALNVQKGAIESVLAKQKHGFDLELADFNNQWQEKIARAKAGSEGQSPKEKEQTFNELVKNYGFDDQEKFRAGMTATLASSLKNEGLKLNVEDPTDLAALAAMSEEIRTISLDMLKAQFNSPVGVVIPPTAVIDIVRSNIVNDRRITKTFGGGAKFSPATPEQRAKITSILRNDMYDAINPSEKAPEGTQGKPTAKVEGTPESGSQSVTERPKRAAEAWLESEEGFDAKSKYGIRNPYSIVDEVVGGSSIKSTKEQQKFQELTAKAQREPNPAKRDRLIREATQSYAEATKSADAKREKARKLIDLIYADQKRRDQWFLMSDEEKKNKLNEIINGK